MILLYDRNMSGNTTLVSIPEESTWKLGIDKFDWGWGLALYVDSEKAAEILDADSFLDIDQEENEEALEGVMDFFNQIIRSASWMMVAVDGVMDLSVIIRKEYKMWTEDSDDV